MTFTQRKSDSQKKTPPKSHNPQKSAKHADLPVEMDERSPGGYKEGQVMQQRPKRLKRPTKSVNENLEPAFNSAGTLTTNSSEYQPSSYEFSPGDYGASVQEGVPFHVHSPAA